MLSKSDINFSIPQFIEAYVVIGIYDAEDEVLIDNFSVRFNTTTDEYKHELYSIIGEVYALYGDYVFVSALIEQFDYL